VLSVTFSPVEFAEGIRRRRSRKSKLNEKSPFAICAGVTFFLVVPQMFTHNFLGSNVFWGGNG
jgi:hypothetical protein